MSKAKTIRAFTIVELIIVITVIAILATITTVIYRGVTQKAVNVTLQSDASNVSDSMKIFMTLNNVYPTTYNCSVADSTTNLCLKLSRDNEITTFNVDNSSSEKFYFVTIRNTTDNTSINVTATGTFGLSKTDISCPSGFIAVPGSTTYGTTDFCVMKYEAKKKDGTSTTIPVSTANNTPWVSITQDNGTDTDAMSVSQNVENCTNCHLISEAEWMTIAQNVLSVASNWSGGSVGNGFIYAGHNSNNPGSALAANIDDSQGWSGMTAVTKNTTNGNDKRTLILTNGEVIWDLAGNAYEWTSGQISGANSQPQAGTSTGYDLLRQWNTITSQGTLSIDPRPCGSGVTGNNTAASSTWNTSKGVGNIYNNPAETALKGIFRGGAWADGTNAGVFGLNLSYAPSGVYEAFGFRVAAPAQ